MYADLFDLIITIIITIIITMIITSIITIRITIIVTIIVTITIIISPHVRASNVRGVFGIIKMYLDLLVLFNPKQL